MAAMETFLDDYGLGARDGRYVDAELPALPFADGAFDLAVCSHFLFLSTKQLNEDFHVAAVRELRRVATEARIFPLLALGGAPSPHVAAVTARLGAGTSSPSRLCPTNSSGAAIGCCASAERHSTRVQRRSRPIWCSTRPVALPCASRSNVICASTTV